MQNYSTCKTDLHKVPETTGILLVNLGTPTAPTKAATRQFLSEFLSDPRVIEAPRFLWWFILNFAILPFRSGQASKNYSKIWTDEGSPLLAISKRLCIETENAVLSKHPINIKLGMRYGEPSIENALSELRESNATHIIVIPLFPQYSSTTTGSVYDAVSRVFMKWRYIPKLTFLNHYADNKYYVEALSKKIQTHWEIQGKGDKLLFSFHGLPKAYITAGDPYYCYCAMTVDRIAKHLQLASNQYEMVFQSRFGPKEWLQPYCDETLIRLAKEGIKTIDIIAPGFAVDCLETLEELMIRNKNLFIEAGGEQFHYITALNDSYDHVNILQKLIEEHL